MKKTKAVSTFLLLTFLFFGSFGKLTITSAKAYSKTIYVDVANFGDPYEDGSLARPFDAIQKAVDAASPGDIVQVASGVYYEYVQIQKSSISLIGENGTIIDGGGTRNGIRVGALPGFYADNVSVSSFNVRNCVTGVLLVRCRYAFLRNVSMAGNAYNFADYSLHGNDIDASNTVDGKPIYYWVDQHSKQVPADAGHVALINCTNIVVQDLTLTKNGQGISVKRSSGILVENLNVSGNWDGVYIDASSSKNMVVNCTVSDNLFMGIYVSASWETTIINNRISENKYGVFLSESANTNTIMNNTIEENENGLYLFGETDKIVSSNVVRANTFSNNVVGVSLLFSKDNIIYHNNFVNNSKQAKAFHGADMWDYNGEGNYWSDYDGEDLNADGVGETPYLVDDDSRDSHPLMGAVSFFVFAWQEEDYYVLVISNSTVLAFLFSQHDKLISLNVTGEETTTGFCRANFPIILLGDPYNVSVDGSTPASLDQASNGTYTFFYFTYEHDVGNIEIKGTTVISEFSPLTLMLFFAVALAAMLLYRLEIKALGKTGGVRHI